MKDWTVIGYYKRGHQIFVAYYRAVNAIQAAYQVGKAIQICGIVEGKHTVHSGI